MREMLIGALERMLLCRMPEQMRRDVQALIRDPSASEYQLKSAYQRYAKRLVLQRPREEIAWNPAVDEAACVGCGVCHDFCPHQVYAMREGKAVVVRPTECVILCSNCMPKCPAGAITFPEKKEYIDYLDYEYGVPPESWSNTKVSLE